MQIELAEPPRTAIAAAIRRATFAAHKEVEKLDADLLKRVEQVYSHAAAEISARIAAHAGADGNLALAELRSALDQVNGVLAQLNEAKNVLLQGGLAQAATLGVKPFTGGAAAAATITTEASMAIANEALTFVRSFVAEDGLQLSDRIWRLDRHARELVTARIEQAVIQGHGAAQAAQELLTKGLTVPPELRAKIGDAAADKLAKETGAALLKGPGAPLDNAKRLFRTEINRAHGEAYMKSGEGTPGFAGWRYLLSPAHPKPDICDLLSRQNLYGLGPGAYPNRQKTPWPAHPNTLSFIVIVFEDEISEKDKAGKETPLEAMARLTDAQRKGVLGAGKLQLLEAGKLTTGMIRTPLRAAMKRATAIETTAAKAKVAAAAAAAKQAEALARAAEKAKQGAALEQMNAIAAAKKGFPFQAMQSLQKGGALKGLQPAAALEQIAAAAATLKAKKAVSDALAKYKKAALAGKAPPPAATKAFDALPDAEKQAFTAKLELAKQEAAKAAALAGDLRYADLEQIGPQQGSNAGGLFRHKATGEQWYVKTPASADVARNEVLASKLYHAAGVEAAELQLVDVNGKTGVASRFVANLRQDADAFRAGKVPGAMDGFAVDAWLGNWDVAGMSFDNMLIRDGRAFRVDVGGALRYRAQGSPKGSGWGPVVNDLETLRNPNVNAQTAAVFRRITPAQLQASAARLQALDDDEIRRLVKQYGPVDAVQNQSLADTLIARKQDVLAKVKPSEKPVPLPVDAAARVTDVEQRLVRESRLNGFVFPSDKGDIEDHHVLVWVENAKDRTPRTVAQFKLTGEASGKLAHALKASGADVHFDDRGVYEKVVEAIKGIASQAAKNEALRDKDLERVRAASAAYSALLKATKEAPARARIENHFGQWMKAAERAVEVGAGKPAKWQPPGNKTLLERYVPPPEKPQEGAIAFAKRAGVFERKRIERGFATSTDETSYSRGYFYEATVNGNQVRYWPNAADVPFALRNQVQILTAGDGAPQTQKLFDTVKALGINSERAGALDREELYLRQIAYHRRDDFADFMQTAAAKEDQAERVAAMKTWLNGKVGKDITKSPAWNPDGTYQAFGQGRKHTFRADLYGKDWEKFQADYVLYHHITQGGLVDSIETILNSGGQLAPTADKLRRGLPIGGMSPDADLDTGGASYLFTRIRSRATAGREPGLVWKSRLLARLDTISYGSDKYGRVTGSHVLENRRTGIGEWRQAARGGSNETIFKNGLSLFDDLEHIVVDSGDYDRLIAVFRKHGYHSWPDGRPLDEVIKRRGSL